MRSVLSPRSETDERREDDGGPRKRQSWKKNNEAEFDETKEFRFIRIEKSKNYEGKF